MFCHVCGKTLVDGARFCSFCGTPVPAEILNQTPAAAPEQSEAIPMRVVGASAPASAPEPPARHMPETPAEPETVTVRVTVREDQIRSGEAIMIDDPRLAAPLQLRLRPGMKHGTRMRLNNAVFRDDGSGARRELIVRLEVPEPAQPVRPVEPVQPVQQARPSQKAVQPEQPASEPQQTAQASGAQQTGARVLATDARCGFYLGKPGKTDGYHYGGDDNGYAQIRTDGFSLSKQSKLLAATTGVIGSMIEGHGKDFLRVGRSDIVSYRKADHKRMTVYYLSLASGQELKLYFIGNDAANCNAAMDACLQG